MDELKNNGNAELIKDPNNTIILNQACQAYNYNSETQTFYQVTVF